MTKTVVMDWVHLHLALNHLPVVGVLFIFGLLLLGVSRGSEELKRLSLQLAVGLFIVSMLVKTTGEQSASRLFPEPTEATKVMIVAHENSADQAVTGAFLFAVLAAAGLYRSRKNKVLPNWSVVGCLVLGLLTIVLLGRSANLGGKIAHPEIRNETRGH